MVFEFVDVLSVDREARKRIRSHVMKGRNSGRIRPKQSSHRGQRIQSEYCKDSFSLKIKEHSSSNLLISQKDSHHSEIEATPARPIVNEIAMWPFPIKVSVSSQEMVFNFLTILNEALYPKEICRSPQVSQLIWFDYLFRDEIYLYSALALSSICLRTYRCQIQESNEVVQHLARAYHGLNEKLSSSEQVSDLTIATVIYLSLYERFQGNYESGQIHVRGLKRMVEMRGGVATLANNTHLVHKIFQADIEMALHDGTHTIFRPIDVSGEDHLTYLRKTLMKVRSQSILEFGFLNKLEPHTRDSFIDLLALNISQYQTNQLSSSDFSDILNYIDYKILRVTPERRLESHSCIMLDELILNSMKCFMVGFWHQPCLKGQRFSLLYNSLREGIEQTISDDQNYSELVLWILFIGSLSIFHDLTDQWFISCAANTITGLRLSTWEDALQILRVYPWLHAFHDVPGKRLWEAVAKTMALGNAITCIEEQLQSVNYQVMVK